MFLLLHSMISLFPLVVWVNLSTSLLFIFFHAENWCNVWMSLSIKPNTNKVSLIGFIKEAVARYSSLLEQEITWNTIGDYLNQIWKKKSLYYLQWLIMCLDCMCVGIILFALWNETVNTPQLELTQFDFIISYFNQIKVV